MKIFNEKPTVKSVLFTAFFSGITALLLLGGAKAQPEVFGIKFSLLTLAALCAGILVPGAGAIWGCLLYMALGLFYPVFPTEETGRAFFNSEAGGLVLALPMAIAFTVGSRQRFESFFSTLSWLILIHTFILFISTIWAFFISKNLNYAISAGFVSQMSITLFKCICASFIWLIFSGLTRSKREKGKNPWNKHKPLTMF